MKVFPWPVYELFPEMSAKCFVRSEKCLPIPCSSIEKGYILKTFREIACCTILESQTGPERLGERKKEGKRVNRLHHLLNFKWGRKA